MSSNFRHLTWENFYDDYLKPEIPAVHPVEGDPAARIAANTNGRPLSVSIEVSRWPASTLPNLGVIRATRERDEERLLWITAWIEDHSLAEPFYAFAQCLVDQVQLRGLEPELAAHVAWEQFLGLFRTLAAGSEQTRIGLWGELWFLSYLVNRYGPSAVNWWRGAENNIHDFRYSHIEIEVKTTTGSERSHWISGLNQLQPSNRCELRLVSLQITKGSGSNARSVRQIFNELKNSLDGDASAQAMLDEKVTTLGVGAPPEFTQDTPMLLRSNPSVCTTGKPFPKLTHKLLSHLLSGDSLQRITQVQYQVDVTGLGIEYGSNRFEDLVAYDE